MKKNILTLAILGSLSTGSFAQDPRNSDFKVTAKIDAGCFLEADNLNFGVLMMPLSDSITQSNMRVQCSKGANLEILINYDSSQNNVSLSDNPDDYYTITRTVTRTVSHTGANYTGYDLKGIGRASEDFFCYDNGNPEYEIHVNNEEVMKFFGYTRTGYQEDTKGICSDNVVNFSTLQKIMGTGIKNHGTLIGLSSSEGIKYFVENPSNSQSWSNSNTYVFNGNGEIQSIPMKANIKRADNPTHRMTPDTYQSTLTVVLNY